MRKALPLLVGFLVAVGIVLASPKAVQAGYCGGDRECCQQDTQKRCNGDPNGTPCRNISECNFNPCLVPDPVPVTCSQSSYCSFWNNDVSGCNNAFLLNGCMTRQWTPVEINCGWVGSAPTPTPGPSPTPGGGGGGGICSSACATDADCGGGLVCDTWDFNPGQCWGAGCGGGGGGGGDPCPADTCIGSCCNYICGQNCIVTADCKNPSAGGQPTWCNPATHKCVNANCPNNTIPGTICGCSGGILCGNPCAGGCIGGSTCRYTQAPGGNCAPGASTYCVGNTGDNYHTFNSGFVTPQCTSGDTGNKMLQKVSNGQTTGFTLAQIQSTCPTATVRARAKIISGSDTTCAAIDGSTSYLINSIFNLSPALTGGAKTQTGSSYVSWTTTSSNTFSLVATVPSGYALRNACWTRTPTAPTSGTGLSASVNIAGPDTLSWDLGYSLGVAWAQTQGGDVMARDRITSLMTSLAVPRLFSINGTGGYPGVAFYGYTGATPYDFDEGTGQGETYVSTPKWLANEPGDGGSKDPYTTDWYQYFLYQFDRSPLSAQATPDYDNPAAPITKPASRLLPYLVSGNMETMGDWTIGNGETIVFLVTGNATIKGKINITGNGFFAMITNGNITVDPTVGVPFSSSTPVVEGFYITSPTGSFITGASTNPGTERFVGRGTFIAGSFLLQRDLASVAHNADTSAELFIYNPQLLLTMPEQMKKVKITWTEVAP